MANEQYLVIARKWRPQRFDDVVGQAHITRTLKNAIASGRIHHAFLFIGSRGIGKTTTARILAKALNCLNSDSPTPEPCGTCDNCTSIGRGNNMDVIEIDGASNNGVDDVREIRENIRMVPSNGRYKVYIIDEVHQLSAGAFNALLKTLEEPPPHAVFVLATTEAHKIPATIVSRCQRYDFRRVPAQEIIALLTKVLDAEGRKASDEALFAIARAAEGGIRDAESILDELITYCDGEITFTDVNDVLGLVDWTVLHELTDSIHAQDIGKQLTLIEQVASAGKDLSQFVEELLRYYRNLLICKTADARTLLHLPDIELDALEERAGRYSLNEIIRMVEQFAELNKGFDSQLAQRIALEALLIRLSKVGADVSLDSVLDKLTLLAEQGPAPAAPARPAAAAAKVKAPEVPAGPAAAAKPEAPPDPPEAAPERRAQPEPAPAERATVTPDNLRAMWDRIVQEATKSTLSLGVWLGAATPESIEGDTVVLHFGAQSGKAYAFLGKPESREALEAALQASTDNLRTYRTVLVEAPSETPETEPEPDLPIYRGVDPQAARAALDDPGVQAVLNVFKGRIAKIVPAAAESKDS